jgi:hypothetical protein
VRQGSSKRHLEPECDRATGIAALGAAILIFLAGRRSGSNSATTACKDVPAKPDPPKRTPLGEAAHWFTWPVRKEDQEKQRLKENPLPDPEPTAEACKKSFGCITLSCGETETDKAENEGDDSKTEDEAGSLTSIVVKVLGAIATGIGVTGAVVAVGAAVFWARFDAIGLPATQAVAAIPRTELLVQGAQEMILFVLVGLGAALAIALADPKGVITRGSLIVLGLLVTGAIIYPIFFTALSSGWVLVLIGLACAFALASIGIAFATEHRLMPLLVSVFIASFLFSATSAFGIVKAQKYAQAIAIHFGLNEEKKDEGITGIYVTATEKTIYYARSDLDGGADAGLYEVPRADPTTYAVGELEPIVEEGKEPVSERAKALLEALKKDAKSFRAPEAEPTPTPEGE